MRFVPEMSTSLLLISSTISTCNFWIHLRFVLARHRERATSRHGAGGTLGLPQTLTQQYTVDELISSSAVLLPLKTDVINLLIPFGFYF